MHNLRSWFRRRAMSPAAGVMIGLLAMPAAAVTLGVLGDSYTDPYAGQGYTHRNWTEQLAMNPTGVDFGGATPDDLPYNFARAGYWTGNTKSQELPLLLANLDSVDCVVIDIGINDYIQLVNQPSGYTYPDRYIRVGSGEAGLTHSLEVVALSNIQSMISQVRAQDPTKKIILATIPDWGSTVGFRSGILDDYFGIDFTGTGGDANKALRQTFTAAIKHVNELLVSYAAGQGIPVVDKFRLLNKAKKEPKIRFTKNKKINTLYNPSVTGEEGRAYAFWADALHPGTAWHGLYANVILSVLRDYYGEDVNLLTAQQIIASYAGDAAIPRDALAKGWVWDDYILLPPEATPMSLRQMALGTFDVTSVPEPASVLLLSLACPSLVLRRRRGG